MKLNKGDYELFKTPILENVSDDLQIPAELETDILYQFERFRDVSRGYEGLKFFIKKNEEGALFLDYYFVTDDSSSHFRIDHAGKLIRLENFDGQWGWPVYEDEEKTRKEHERMKRHNEKVSKILIAKGFEK